MASMKSREFALSMVAVVAIAYLERLAILAGINGWLLALAVAAIAGLGGYELKGWRERRGSK
ncbi:unnamed protein product [marine sediment metagenome]|uniref:Nidogen G2 beta-barrel domain-containing protein n=1 Tax=marine sediment metagenome TaxID=412755 RepID=X1IGP7_9ZZZZ